MSRLFKANVIENKPLIKNHLLLTLQPTEKIKKPKPGQFFMVSIDDDHDPLLKRPFSIHRWSEGNIRILYRIAGRGTAILARKKPGEAMEVLGPLGNGFRFKKTDDKVLLIAGGLGIAPIYALAESIAGKKPLMFYGSRTKNELFGLEELNSIGINPTISTDDGTMGKKGNIVSVMKTFFKQNPSLTTQYSIYACGPEPMLKSLSLFALKNNIKGYIALEENMACGLGACLGCTVDTVKGYKRVCKEGPVFPIDEIIW